MAKVPTYQPTVTERPAFQQAITVQASAGDMGAAIGEGMQGLARGVQQAGNQLAELHTLEARATATDRLNQLQARQQELALGEGGYLTLSGKAALDGYKKYTGSLDSLRSELSTNLTGEAKQIYDAASSARLLSAQQSALVHRADQNKNWLLEVSTTRQTLMAGEALAYAGNDRKVAGALMLGANEIREEGAMRGWDPQTTDLRIREFESVTLAEVTRKIAQGDAIAAFEFTSRNWEKFLPVDAMKLMDQLAPMLAEAASRDAVDMGSAPMVAPGSAADLIVGFEGFSSTAYADVGGPDGKQYSGHRVGYGSDQVTRSDGSVVAVTPSTVVTREDAKRDLNRRIQTEFLPRAVEAVGAENWSRLDGATQNALLSITYNYGSLPNSVAQAATTGDRMVIASAIDGLAGHNGGVNADRRAKEAALVRNGLGAGVQFSERVETVLGQLPPDMAVGIREIAASEIGKQQAAQSSAERAVSAAEKDRLQLGIVTGSVQSEMDIRNNPYLDDGDKAALVTSYRSAQNETAGARTWLNSWAAGESQPFNVYYDDDRSTANKAFEMAISQLPEGTTPEQRKSLALEFVRSSGIVPDQMIAAVRHDFASTSTATVAAALEQAATLTIAAPLAVSHIADAKDIEEAAATYTSLVNERGLSVEEAAKYVIEQRKPENKINTEILKSAWTEAAKSLSINNVLEAFGDSWTPGGPVAGTTPLQQAALLSTYLGAAEAAFVGQARGDIGIARSIALADLKRTFGVSAVSGQQVIMAFPPEAHFPAIGGSHDYIRAMALNDVRQVAPDAQNVLLAATPETAADIRAGKPPRYAISYVGSDGVIESLPGRFTISPDQLQQLATLDTEQRRIEFEIKRQYDDFMRDRPHDAALSHIERWSAGLVGPPTAADVVPGFADYQSQLVDIDLQRNSLLGNNATGATVMTREQIDPTGAAMDAEAQWNELNAATFGMMGGGVSP